MLCWVLMNTIAAINEETGTLEYYNNDGLIIGNLPEHKNFLALFEYQSTRVYLRSTEHLYWTNLQMFEDPCINKITGLFNQSLGFYDFCNGKLEFVYRKSYYQMDLKKTEKNLTVLSSSKAPEKFNQIQRKDDNSSNILSIEELNYENDELNELIYINSCSSTGNKHDNVRNSVINKENTNQSHDNIINSIINEEYSDTSHKNINPLSPEINNKNDIEKFDISLEKKPESATLEEKVKKTNTEESMYTLNVVVVNNFTRVKRLQNDIVKNTNKLYTIVNQIFQSSGINIAIKITGILNLKKNYIKETEEDHLSKFKNLIEQTRFHRLNLKLPLAKCDLVMMLFEEETGQSRITINDHLKIHGKTFMGGSARLDSSYSFIFTEIGDSDYFIAKKIAHEIGHSLNAKHVNEESIMETSTCKDCSERIRQFSETSVDEILHFLSKNARIFRKKQQKHYTDNTIIRSKHDADEYVKERRKHTYLDIVKTRLQNKTPVLNPSGSGPYIILTFYFITVLLLLIYWARCNENIIGAYRG